MSRFILTLPDDLDAKIEEYRINRGLRAKSEAMRELMAASLARFRKTSPSPEQQVEPKDILDKAEAKAKHLAKPKPRKTRKGNILPAKVRGYGAMRDDPTTQALVKAAEAPKPTTVEDIERVGETVRHINSLMQVAFGPQTHKPGSLLKRPRGKK